MQDTPFKTLQGEPSGSARWNGIWTVTVACTDTVQNQESDLGKAGRHAEDQQARDQARMRTQTARGVPLASAPRFLKPDE
jgi:hypothetical protein